MRLFAASLVICLILSGCGVFGLTSPTATPTALPSPLPTLTETPTLTPLSPTETPTLTPTITLTPTPDYPLEGYGPTNFPADINPLTGLEASESSFLERRPVAIKVNIVPRTSTRPPWGLSSADIVYEFYHNDGYTRFHTIYLGEAASEVGPIRSARLPDDYLIRMYKSIFAYGSADPTINYRLFSADYSNRLILEGGRRGLCPPSDTTPLCRYDPNGYDLLLGGTEEIHAFAQSQGIDDTRQNLDGMFFLMQVPLAGKPAEQVTIRYSGDSYNRWDYDLATGRYLHSQDNVYDLGSGEEFAPLIDQVNNEQVAAENVVILLMTHSYYREPPSEIVDIQFLGTGKAYAFRDGNVYELQWNIPTQGSMISLTFPDGSIYPYKPGNTWFQVIGQYSTVSEPETGSWRFDFLMP
jgi:hypothetical protein